jgi:hypothetical protein
MFLGALNTGLVYAKIELYGQYDYSKINQAGLPSILILASMEIMRPYAGAPLI